MVADLKAAVVLAHGLDPLDLVGWRGVEIAFDVGMQRRLVVFDRQKISASASRIDWAMVGLHPQRYSMHRPHLVFRCHLDLKIPNDCGHRQRCLLQRKNGADAAACPRLPETPRTKRARQLCWPRSFCRHLR
jgi:hypothetical protein